MVDFSDSDKIAVLLRQQDHAIGQLAEIKKDEMSWLKIFLLFYGAVTAWAVSRWLSPGGPPTASADGGIKEVSVIHGTLLIAFMGTLMFCYHFLRTRWSYYGVAHRLSRFRMALRLNDSGTWGSQLPFGSVDSYSKLEGMRDRRTWQEVTKPGSSFATRLVYLAGADLVVGFVGWYALCLHGSPRSIWFFIMLLLANSALILAFFLLDYLHFTRGNRVRQKETVANGKTPEVHEA